MTVRSLNFLSWWSFYHGLVFFAVCTVYLLNFTSGPIGQGGRLVARPWSRPWAGPSASVPAVVLSAGCCPAPRAAVLSGLRCRVGWPAAGQTARAAAVPATLTKISCWHIHYLLDRMRRFRGWRKRCATTRTQLPRWGRTSRISPMKRIDSPRIWRSSAPSTRNSKVRRHLQHCRKYLDLHSVLVLYPDPDWIQIRWILSWIYEGQKMTHKKEKGLNLVLWRVSSIMVVCAWIRIHKNLDLNQVSVQ